MRRRLVVADAQAKRCDQELSGSISSLLPENITDDMESLELSKRSYRSLSASQCGRF